MQLSLILKRGLHLWSMQVMLSTLMPTTNAVGLRSYALRSYADRMRAMNSEKSNLLANMLTGNKAALDQIVQAQENIEDEEDEVSSMLEVMQALAQVDAMSMNHTPAPSANAELSLTSEPSFSPSISPKPSISTDSPSVSPSALPSTSPTTPPTSFPTAGPTFTPSEAPTEMPTGVPTTASVTPSFNSTSSPTFAPSVSSAPPSGPNSSPTQSPISSPSASPSTVNSTSPTTPPTSSPNASPTSRPVACGISPEERSTRILAVLDTVADPILLRDSTTIQGKAANWLVGEDELLVCPDDEKLIQRFALAVIYFATNGDDWLQCSSNPLATDFCGLEDPFIGASRFLSGENECEWAGIKCDPQLCVTKVLFELNNLVGIIPTEIALLSGLQVWGMERGGLTGPIPTEVGMLTNLVFIDLDFNQLTGTLSPELLSLNSLLTLDINDNLMTGSIEGIGVWPSMEFLQLHNNSFTGTVPEAIGTYSNLTAFTLHKTSVSGTMPDSVCNLLRTAGNGGVLDSLIADCGGLNPEIVCPCCTDCRV